jgi:hypothetical protein
MINYILYDQEGTIQQQGSAPDRNLRVMRATLTNLKLMEIPARLTDIDQYCVENNQVVLRTEPVTQEFNYTFVRSQEYLTIGQQLDLLYKDIQAGLFGDAAKTGQFAAHILAVKQQYPKP